MKTFFASLRRSVMVTVCACIVLTMSCQKESLVNPTSQSDDATLDYIESLGYSRDKAVDEGKYYTVEGDISFEKQNGSSKGAKVDHSVFAASPVVSWTNVGDITIAVSSNIPNTNTWRQRIINATIAAIGSWNAISPDQSKLRFRYTTSSSANIIVQYDPDLNDGGFVARGGLPTNCGPSPTVRINNASSDPTTFTPAQLHFIITHELGHSIGFRHTNLGTNGGSEGPGYHIKDTPETEQGSVMNDLATWGYTPNGAPFTSGDKLACETLYPANPTQLARLNVAGTRLEFEWTISRFCFNTVTIDVYKDGLLDYSTGAFNNGFFTETRNVTPGSYEFRVHPTGEPNNSLSAYTEY